MPVLKKTEETFDFEYNFRLIWLFQKFFREYYGKGSFAPPRGADLGRWTPIPLKSSSATSGSLATHLSESPRNADRSNA